MEHGQRPQVAARALGADAAERERVAEGRQVRAAMVEHAPLRVARRAGRVVERDRVPLVVGPRPRERRVALALLSSLQSGDAATIS